jgi:hypothetical protein
MAYTKFEQAYVDTYLETMYPAESEQPDTLLASGPVKSDVQPEFGTIKGIPQTRFEKILEQSGIKLNELGNLIDEQAPGTLNSLTGKHIPIIGELKIRDLLPFVGSEKDGQISGTPGALIAAGTGQPLGGKPVIGSAIGPDGQTYYGTSGSPAMFNQDVGTAVVDVATLGLGKPLAKLGKKTIEATKGLPVGMSTKAVGTGVDELGFYSAAKQAVDAIQQPKGTGDQFLKQIEKTPGVKPDEIKWTGLDDFLKSKKTVTKAEVQEYLDKNKVEIKEFQLGDLKLNEKSEYALPEVLKVLKENQSSGYSGMRLTLANDYDAYQALTKKFPNLEDTDNWEDRVLSELISPDAGGTKFSKFQLPGGTNYREIFITLPTKNVTEEEARVILGAAPDAKLSEADISYASKKNKDDYIVPRAHSAGFNEADVNRIAHLRVNDRVIDGKNTLFVEEVQSDWHQTGRKKGYQGDMSIEQARQKMLDNGYSPEAVANSSDEDIVKMMTQYGVPDAPFKTTWSELSMKRVIQMASEGGYDRIAFTTGKTQAARYDLSKQVKMISAMPDKNGTYNIYIEGKNGDALFRNQNGFGEYGQKIVTPEEFEELVGKDAAKTIMQKSDELNRGKVSKDQFKFYDSKPADLTIGGEGMKGFYDDILPKFLNKYAKKWDAKTGMSQVPTTNTETFAEYLSRKGISESKYSASDSGTRQRMKQDFEKNSKKAGEDVHYFDITPKMRESVMTKGQPMFAIGAGGAGAAATQTEDNK